MERAFVLVPPLALGLLYRPCGRGAAVTRRARVGEGVCDFMPARQLGNGPR